MTLMHEGMSKPLTHQGKRTYFAWSVNDNALVVRG